MIGETKNKLRHLLNAQHRVERVLKVAQQSDPRTAELFAKRYDELDAEILNAAKIFIELAEEGGSR